MLRHHLLALTATNYSGATKYGYQRNPRNVIMTLLFSVLTENDSFRSCIQHIRLPPSCAYSQYKYVYIGTQLYSAHELSECVRADAYNLILIFASYLIIIMLPGPGPVYIYIYTAYDS